MREWLEAIELPAAFRKEFGSAILRGKQATRPLRSVEERRRSAEQRLIRLKDLYELGDLDRETYLRRRDKIVDELAELEDVKVAPVIVAGDQIRTLVDDWPAMSAQQKRRVLDTIFSAVELDGGMLVSATPRPGWLD
ncbi:MAG TPA: hypothetical protein DCK98_14370 [Chloroflexi bacterium]|jgi:hypothetical protein|nr:hypothetical protein [Chloroflexota bacterium]HAL28748.1 hypothetical protein [Chloroflexota bacterium]